MRCDDDYKKKKWKKMKGWEMCGENCTRVFYFIFINGVREGKVFKKNILVG